MSDSKLRELERRWRETKSVDDEAAYLRERVRVGDLTQERLELAAYCGHEGARRAAEIGAVPGSTMLLKLLADPVLRIEAVTVLASKAERLWRGPMTLCQPAELAINMMRCIQSSATADQRSRARQAALGKIAPGNTRYNSASTRHQHEIAYLGATLCLSCVGVATDLEGADVTMRQVLQKLGDVGVSLLDELRESWAIPTVAAGALSPTTVQ